MQNKNKNTKWFKLNILVLILLITSFLTRLVFANFAATQSYELASFSTELKELKFKNEQLTLAATELQSLDRLRNDSARLELVKVDTIYYLEPSGAVAINK